MTYFLRDLPNTIQLLPDSVNQNVILSFRKTHICNTLHIQGLIVSLNRTHHSRERYQDLFFGSYKPTTIIHDKLLILDSFGLIFLFNLFLHVYKRFPQLAIQSLNQAYHFNHNLKGLFIIQALHRLAYAFYGLDYEEFRNKEDIKTRSVIEDFHSILGNILVLPIPTEENKYVIWTDGDTSSLQHKIIEYADFIIDSNDHYVYHPTIYDFILSNGQRYFAPFSYPKSITTNKYGEYRALRNASNNSTYQAIEMEKMGIKTSFEYKKIGLEYNPYDKWEEKEDLKNLNLDKLDWKYDYKKQKIYYEKYHILKIFHLQ